VLSQQTGVDGKKSAEFSWELADIANSWSNHKLTQPAQLVQRQQIQSAFHQRLHRHRRGFPGFINTLTAPMQTQIQAAYYRELVRSQRPIPVYIR
jgi:hypothetical protein